MNSMNLSISLPTSTTPIHVAPPVGEKRPLLTPLDQPGHFLLILDNTSLEKWKRCAVAAKNYLVLRREGHVKTNALVFGGALHEGLDKFHRHLCAEPAYTGTEQLLGPESQDSAIRSYFDNHPHDTDDYRTVDRALQIMAAYRRRAALPDYALEILSDEEGPLIERPFELPLGQIHVGQHIPSLNLDVDTVHVAWSGKIDLVCRIFGTNYILDHKTSSISGDTFIQSFQIASQTMGYTWASRQLWPQHGVLNFCLNAIYFKKPNVGCTDRTAKGVRGGPPPLDFARHFFNYTEPRLLEWQNDTLSHIEDFLHCLVRDYFPSNDKQCFDKYGECPYHVACVEANPVLRATFLKSPAFRDVTWNPVDKTTH